jgi:branched-chain amino acid transport system substrate-binding protein
MRKTLLVFAAAMVAVSSANAQETVKIGLIMAYSGQFADPAAQMDNSIKLYIKQHGDTVAGKKIEIIRKDTGGPNPDVAKRLAQELVVRDRVDILAGFTGCGWPDRRLGAHAGRQSGFLRVRAARKGR